MREAGVAPCTGRAPARWRRRLECAPARPPQLRPGPGHERQGPERPAAGSAGREELDPRRQGARHAGRHEVVAGLAVSQGRHTYRGHQSSRALRVLTKLGPGIADVTAVDVALGLRRVGALFTERIRREMERKGVRFTATARGGR